MAEPSDPIAVSRTPTDPLRFTLGDRAAVDNEFKILRAQLETERAANQRVRDDFFAHRMEPHEAAMNRLRFLLGFSLGFALIAAIESTICLAIVLWKHG